VLDRAAPFPVDRTGVLAGKTLFTLATGANHSLALCSDGTVASWGNNGYGQLGNNSTTDRLVPVSVSTTGVLLNKTVIAIAAGQYHNLALCSDGTLAAWGYNFYGQLGNGLTSESSVPVAVNKTGVLAGKTIISIAAGTYHSFALCSDGTLAAWGYNGNGELGNGGTGFSPLPVTVDNSGVLAGKTVRSVIAGSFHNFALCTDGTLAGWGYNAFGQLGNNNANNSTVPVSVLASGVLAGKTIVSASAGYYHTLALCSDGTLAAWGSNGYGELGNGNNTASMVPVAVTLDGVLAGKSVSGLSAGALHNIVLCADGTLATWGYNGDGELGNNSAVSSNMPVLVSSAPLAPGERFVAGKSGPTSLHTLALLASPPLPVVTTLAASSITATSAVLNGALNPNGTATTPTFEYGLTTAYGTSVVGSPASVTGTASTAVSATISGLAPGTTYHYRLSGTRAGGTITSADGIFTTAGYNANLSGLALSTGTLDPVFATATTGYATSVPSTTTTISVTPTVATPSSTVKVNGAAVVSGSASTPIFLLPGNNTITVIVTAQDAVTTKSYTISVTRLSPAPEIGVTQSGIPIADGGSKDFGPATGSRPAVVTFVIKNTGNSDLTGLGITIDGADASQFSLSTLPISPVPGPAGSTTFSVAFTPASVGTKSAALHLSSNDADENFYDIALTGTGLSSTTDTDGDGLNDAAEFQMEALGFNWQVSQPDLVNVYFANAEAGGLGSGQGLYLDAPKLTKNPATGLFRLEIGIQKSTDLLNFTPFLMTAPQTRISGDGKLEFEFASPDNAAFYRLLAE
jgi:alpha-tubulin suppressor-like RCC1 family protein